MGNRTSLLITPRASLSSGTPRAPVTSPTPEISSPYVNHAAADALVNAAASVWTVPTANFNLLYGGALAEHASSANVYATSTGIVFPSDILEHKLSLSKQIAVLYDSDGSIIDTMLGSGASSPSSCRQNAVLESVDSISAGGKIQHAVLVLNGRCTGPAPEQQLQLNTSSCVAFGRIIGLAWSQTNDNVFTGTPTPTIQQALHWPIMHPVDIALRSLHLPVPAAAIYLA